MILVDTSVWIDHLKRGDPTLTQLLINGEVLGHPAVLGEIGLGSLAHRAQLLALLANLRQAVVATHDEVMAFIEAHSLFGRGIGYVDAHLLAAAALTSGSSLWTRDRKLRAVATELGHPAVHT